MPLPSSPVHVPVPVHDDAYVPCSRSGTGTRTWTLRRGILPAFGACVLLATTNARAQPVAPEAVPPALASWVPWVLDEAGDARCPELNGVRVCVWPSALTLDVAGNAARFALRVTNERAAIATLPGSFEHWPLDVEVDARRVPVLERDGAPALLLERGAHLVTGRFAFVTAPAALRVPPNVAALSLRKNGLEALRPRREADGLLWIDERAARAASEERLTLSVHRRLEDAVPLRVITRLELTAAGAPREFVLEQVVLARTRPVELRADLPAQLSPTGSLRVQLAGGTHRIEIVAVSELPVPELRAPAQPAPWPDHEVWVFQADERLRHVELEGPPQVDAAHTDLAPDWRGLPTFLVSGGARLGFVARRRGQPEPGTNRIQLERSLWLDLDGDGYTVRDQLRGSLQRGFRLDLDAGRLGHAVIDGADALITRRGAQSGIELRSGDLDVVTEWRLERAKRELPAVGYSEDIEALSATLHLPPGFMLLGASGVDVVRGSWLDGWDLFDFFFVLLTVLAVAKLAGPALALAALLALTLSEHVPDAPRFTWLLLLAATALTRALPRGRWAKLARGAWMAALIALVVVLVPFAVGRARAALYPQLDEPFEQVQNWAEAPEQAESQAEVEARARARGRKDEAGEPARRPRPASAADAHGGGALEVYGSLQGLGLGSPGDGPEPEAKQQLYATRELIDPNAFVQTGPGVPSWRFAEFSLHWSGPVERHERVSLWLSPPGLTRLWSLAALALSALLLFGLARLAPRGPAASEGDPEPPLPSDGDGPHARRVAAAGALLACSLAPALADAQAQTPPPLRPAPVAAHPNAPRLAPAPGAFAPAIPQGSGAASLPDTALLSELRARLLRAPACAPHCLAIPSLALSLAERRLDVRVDVHAAADAIYRAPGPLDQWPVDRIRLDGQDTAAARVEDGFLHVRLPPGLHVLELSGPLSSEPASTLALGTPAPHRVDARARGWRIEGLHADGTSDGSLELRREAATGAGPQSEQALTPWLEVRRELELGLRFRVRTTITRLGPAGESVLVRLRLLEGESVTEAQLLAEQDSVLITLARGQRTFAFSSTLAPRARLDLEAAEPSEHGVLLRPYSETWVVRPSPLYRVHFEGIPPVSQLSESQHYEPSYRPWPGERVIVHTERLEPAEGASVTVDGAHLRFAPGARSEQSTLRLALRASRGTTEQIVLPADATLASLEIDGRPHPARLERGTLEVPLGPGHHTVVVASKRPAGLGFRYAPQPPSLSRPLTNAFTSIVLPSDRWLLATGGPAWGPAVLAWGYLVVVLLAALALGRTPRSPLRTRQWAILGLGLTQVEPPVALVVVGWLFALAYRESAVIEKRRLFNFVQVLLVLFTLVALSCLAYAVHRGLLVPPEMQVQGMLSNRNFVQWYTDRSPGAFPEVTLYSAPMWIYKAVMLLWALWLAASLVYWLRWGWTAFRKGGGFRPKPRSGPRTSGMRAPDGTDAPSAPGESAADRERARVS